LHVERLAVWCGPLAGAAFLGGVAAGIALADSPYPRPGATPAAIRRYFHGNARAARVSITGQLCSAAALARFTASVADLARQTTTDQTDTDTLAAASCVAGAAATCSLAASALQSLALTRGGQSDATAVALHRRVFLTGGPMHTAAFGALVGCLSLAGHRTRQLPDRLTRFRARSNPKG
jgi:hypothetical protein